MTKFLLIFFNIYIICSVLFRPFEYQTVPKGSLGNKKFDKKKRLLPHPPFPPPNPPSLSSFIYSKLDTEVSAQGRVDCTVGRAKAEDELVGAEAALGCSWVLREGLEEHGGGGLDLTFREATERFVLNSGDASQEVMLHAEVIDAIESDNQWER
ncbi:hypothetical protein ACFX1R_039235 [Malus domestica]